MANTPIPIQDLIALALVPGAGRKAIHTAVRWASRAGQPLHDLFGRPLHELATHPGASDPAVLKALKRCGQAEQERAEYLVDLANAHGIRHWTCHDTAYPAYLRTTLGNQAPPFLFYQGNEALLEQPGAAIVGTRRPSGEGREWARKAAAFFAEEAIPVVSGGAAGIDTEAHEAALRADGTTIVVLPEGLHSHNVAPALRRGLENGQALFISEFLPSSGWSTPQALTRNRTIAACARLACVIEPGDRGGSRHTAEQTLAQDKPVFCWGGACRNGYLQHTPGAQPLGSRHGDLQRQALQNALTPAAPELEQGDLFTR